MALKRYRLVQRRKMLGFCQERLAEVLQVERSTVVRWELAETDPQPWHRTRIAEALQVSLDELQKMLDDVSVATARGNTMGDSTDHTWAPARTELLAGLRAFLTDYLPSNDFTPQGRPSLPNVRRAVGQVHNLYQRTSYSSAARLLPEVLRDATELARAGSGLHRAAAFKLLAAAYVAASKVACKVGDGETTRLTADRAATSARLAEDQALAAVAAYQAACALLRLPDRLDEAEHVAHASLEHLALERSSPRPDLLSAHGALLLLAAIISARRGDAKEAALHLAQAQRLANGWTVCVIATPTAATWIDRDALAKQTGYLVRSEWRRPGEPDVLPKADAVVVAPATFNTINKWALGISDNLALGILNEALGMRLPILASPYAKYTLTAHPAYARHTELLRTNAVRFIATEESKQPSTAEPISWPGLAEAVERLRR
ncbi:flavoprotein [Micromonospora luteifusca]|uniref:flavoprotein n=1 Tax=Micromonospora luteifusca TaxID=709860 RepID=UPI0033A5B743